MASVTQTVAVVFTGEDKGASAAAAGIASGLDKVSKAGPGVNEASKSLDGLEKSTKSAESAIGLLKGAFAGLTVAALARAFVDTNVEMERFTRGMTAVKGSSELAAQEFEYVKRTAKDLGLDLFSTAKAYTDLSAASKGTALQGADTRLIFEAVAKAMAALGKSSADTEGALVAIQQMMSKGKVSAEELRGQLGERLPGAFQLAAKAMGLTTEELSKQLEQGNIYATDFLPKFAGALNDAFKDASFEGYTKNLNNLRTAIDEALIQAGQTGAFSILTDVIGLLAQGVGVASISFTTLGKFIGATAALAAGGSWEDFKSNVAEITAEADKAADALSGGLNKGLKDTDAALKEVSSDEFAAETNRLKSAAKEGEEATSRLNASLKALGVDPKKFTEDFDKIKAALADLASNPKTNGEQFVAGFEAALKKARTNEDLQGIGATLTKAFMDGKIGAEAFYGASAKLGEVQTLLAKGLPNTTEALRAQEKATADAAKELRKADEDAKKLQIELEKIASNERIKTFELKAQINIAQIEADTKKIISAFESIDNTVNSTGDTLNTLFGLFKDYSNLDWSAIRAIQDQIKEENRRRDEALALQKKLTEAQIEQMRAQTQALLRGDAMIKVDGAGLQPHLEAFMWEILRTIQIRVNQDGLGMLLGT